MIGPDVCYNMSELALMEQLRDLWIDHVIWTRAFIISTAEGLGDLDVVTARLLKNPDDFAILLGMIYGTEIADDFKQLLTEHLLLAADLVNAAKAGDSQAAQNARTQWYDNADAIANFLSAINPNWSESTWQSHLYDHLALTEQEATYRLNGDYEEDVMIFDEIKNQAMDMADYMFEGLLQQFEMS